MTITAQQLNHELKQAGIALNGVELHGLLTGFICGGIRDESWKSLLYKFTNEDHAYPVQLISKIAELYKALNQSLSDLTEFTFDLDLGGVDDIYQNISSLSEWCNHFLLGLGLAQPNLQKEQQQDIVEALADLREICQLGYEEDDDEESLENALEEIIEYLRTIAMLFYSHFSQATVQHKTIH
ncbi:UPF0149 family protein [Gallibacterium genomosp. 3]|uniref:UPF0149 protein QV07_00635 n=1 Tax=Gallibacterium genomosp. 3 TaxID=505345 RepID=A0A1A7QCS9_9PAST|nr:UPF0149 family protein [Gallibacterium genomosp. 3]OBX11956.1 hypothetical protein QV07_00635 [Gallibacterium genomosp. 3]